MNRWHKRHVVVEAVQFLDGVEVLQIIKLQPGKIAYRREDGRSRIVIETPEGDMTANVGDWIIRGIAGEVYPCKDEIFRATYDLATQVDHV
jgi:uncharacterized membrane protein (UPF0127 family)